MFVMVSCILSDVSFWNKFKQYSHSNTLLHKRLLQTCRLNNDSLNDTISHNDTDSLNNVASHNNVPSHNTDSHINTNSHSNTDLYKMMRCQMLMPNQPESFYHHDTSLNHDL